MSRCKWFQSLSIQSVFVFEISMFNPFIFVIQKLSLDRRLFFQCTRRNITIQLLHYSTSKYITVILDSQIFFHISTDLNVKFDLSL